MSYDMSCNFLWYLFPSEGAAGSSTPPAVLHAVAVTAYK